MDTLIIDGVDLKFLDRQRLSIASINRDLLTEKQAESLDGIQNMLDHWSDLEANK